MKLTHISDSIRFQCGDMIYSFLPTGDIELFTHGRTMINGYIGNAKDGSANNIWLRIYRKNKIDSYPLLGISSDTHVSKGAYGLKFSGTADNIAYEPHVAVVPGLVADAGEAALIRGVAQDEAIVCAVGHEPLLHRCVFLLLVEVLVGYVHDIHR